MVAVEAVPRQDRALLSVRPSVRPWWRDVVETVALCEEDPHFGWACVIHRFSEPQSPGSGQGYKVVVGQSQ